jgi:hypothetical protein
LAIVHGNVGKAIEQVQEAQNNRELQSKEEIQLASPHMDIYRIEDEHMHLHRMEDKDLVPQQIRSDEEIVTWDDDTMEKPSSTFAGIGAELYDWDTPLQALDDAAIEFETIGRDELIQAYANVDISENEYSDGEVSVLSDEVEGLLEVNTLKYRSPYVEDKEEVEHLRYQNPYIEEEEGGIVLEDPDAIQQMVLADKIAVNKSEDGVQANFEYEDSESEVEDDQPRVPEEYNYILSRG